MPLISNLFFIILFYISVTIREPVWSSEESLDFKDLRYERNWKQLNYLTSDIPIESYLDCLLNNTGTNNTNSSNNDNTVTKSELFLTRIESLYKLKMYDDIILLTETLLTALNEHAENYKANITMPSYIEDAFIMIQLISCEMKIITGRSDEALQLLQQIEIYIQYDPTDPTHTTDLNHTYTDDVTSNVYTRKLAYPHIETRMKWQHVITAIKINCFIRQHLWTSVFTYLTLTANIYNYFLLTYYCILLLSYTAYIHIHIYRF